MTTETILEDCVNCPGVKATARLSNTMPYCCIACAFHPLGCRCRFGELGMEETWWDAYDGAEAVVRTER